MPETQETKIATRLMALGCPQTALALFADYSPTKLSKGLRANGNGPDAIDPRDAAHLLQVLDEVERLAASVSPIPIDWRQSGVVAQILQERRRSKVFVVRFAGGQFAGLDAHGRPVAKNEGLVLGGEAAHRVCEELRAIGFQGVSAQRVESDVEAVSEFVLAWRAQ